MIMNKKTGIRKRRVLKSTYTPLVGVVLPGAEKGRQYYMHAFDISNPTVPEGFEDYLAPICELIKASGYTKGTAYLTVDEKLIKKGATQRKPKPHVDGYFVPEFRSWSHQGGGGGGWNHNCNIIPGRMPVIVASNFPACKAWKGEFEGEPKEDGDCSHIELYTPGKLLPANVGYLLSPDCIHESLPMEEDTLRTFIRIALPIIQA
jgi:hypothetical protein